MKVPLSWLKEFVAIEVTPEALVERLTFAGLEVEGLTRIGSDFKDIVVGEVISVNPHPNADRLTLCDVATGRETVRVVCGAPNVRAGNKVPFAAIGAVLPNGMKIKSAKIRGEASFGMLCAEDELGLSEDHAGLMQLPCDIPAGTPLIEVVGGPDVVLTIEVTPNRPDCLSILGIAREVAALYGCRLNLPSIKFPETGPAADGPARSATHSVAGGLTVVVEDTEGCPRYTARLLRNVTIGPSPLAMRLRLARCGIRPINNIVDITNYVMLECGQPLHAFDLALLAEGRIVVRRATLGEKMTTLDEVERKLTPDMLVIADAQSPVAIAGVMGGAQSGILATTRDVVLESACFKPALIRKTSKTLGLSSESSYRFERGVDIGGVDWASRRATALMVAHAGAAAARGVVDCFPVEPKGRSIVCRFDRVRDLLGVDIQDNEIASLFEALTLTIVDRSKKSCTVKVPTFRPDLEAEVDLIEEVARLYGLDKIPSALPHSQFVSGSADQAPPERSAQARALRPGEPGVNDAFIRATIMCRDTLVGLGLTEIINYSLVSEKLLTLCDAARTAQRIVLPRPISVDQAILRDALLPQMIETLGRNRSRQIAEAAFFEIGRVFFRNDQQAYTEEEHVALGLMGPVGRTGYDKRSALAETDSFLWLKGILEALCRKLFIRVDERPAYEGQGAGLAFQELTVAAPPALYDLGCFEKNRAMVITLDGMPCGVFGLVREALRREWRLVEPVAILEIRLAPLLERVTTVPAAERLPVYPSVTRDIALRINNRLRHVDIVNAIWKIAPKELTTVELFDIFSSNEIGVGCKSMAYSLTYRSGERTLTDDEVNRLHLGLKDRLRNEISVEIR
ncbi:MAG: phenylalanine--tRNA ligase subunit beta [Verrucomicrobia bacterium]|nr:phenylalanine--tRNA ligase subunit beta [Verrucomicrobiota bacterium]MBU1734908.1 phenylalanine--tRNA ligase subunit beta [Verrucomicrobiota bacterium]MBU1857702.1 phenylalanine--tRNA ligase subunit beta [Verrucomicrobiota bacterium]